MAATTFFILILICSTSIDKSLCDVHSAYDHMEIPVASELQCNGVQAQAVLAANGAALAPRPGKDYMLVRCRHLKVAQR